MNCTKCGFPLTPDSRFCQSCGRPVANEHNSAAGKWQEFKHMLSGGTETILAVLGSAIGKKSMATGQSEGGYAILSDKRLYLKGKIYRKRGNTFLPRIEENILDIKDISSTGYVNQNPTWMVKMGIIGAILFFAIFFILKMEMDKAKNNSPHIQEETANFLLFSLVVTMIAAIVFLVYYKKCHANIFRISYAGGDIGLNTAYIPKEELDFFQSCIRQQKDVLDAAPQQVEPYIAQPQTDPVAQLRQYKELLDDGIITQEEFENRKKALLDKII